MGGIHLTSFIVLFNVQKCLCVCVCVCVMYHVTTQGFPLPNCHSLSHSSELAPQLEVLQLFKTHRHPIHTWQTQILPLWNSRPALFLCLVCGIYQTGSHSPALRTKFDMLRRFCRIPTLPGPLCVIHSLVMHGVCGHIQYFYNTVNVCPIVVALV